MKFTIFFFALAFVALASLANDKVIYGADDRLDIVAVTNALHKRLAASTAAMVENRKLHLDTNGNCTLKFDETLETGANVCPSEAFSNQPIGAMCSGFLVGDDTLVTAGHCLKSLGGMGYFTADSVCKGFSWVFGYAVDSRGRNPLRGPANDVYRCKQVVAAVLDNNLDYAVIKLDRKVTGRAPLKFRTTGKIADNTKLVVIGHPTGLPSKVSAGARVLNNRAVTTFLTNLDTFHGNSGSGVFDATTGQLEGILVQGQSDYRPSDLNNRSSCQVVNECQDSGLNCELPNLDPRAPKGEVVTRITQLTRHLPAVTSAARR